MYFKLALVPRPYELVLENKTISNAQNSIFSIFDRQDKFWLSLIQCKGKNRRDLSKPYFKELTVSACKITSPQQQFGLNY